MPAASTDRAASADRSLSIVIPAYNVAGNILGALVMADLARFPGARLLVNEGNMGFGWSHRRGVAAARRSLLLMIGLVIVWPAIQPTMGAA
jgi:hypothetical protein